MITNFVALPVALDILMMYLIEGNKILFRYAYAVLKTNKNYIKKANNAEEFLGGLKANSRTTIDPKKLKRKAFKYPLKRSNYNFKKATAGTFGDGKGGA